MPSSTRSRRPGRSSSTSGSPRRGAAALPPRSCSAPRPRAVTPASAGPRPGGSSRELSPTSSPTASTRSGWPARSVEHAIPSLVFAGTAADVTNVVVGGRDVVRGGAHIAARRRRGARRSARGGSAMSSLVVDNIGQLVTGDPELGEGPLGVVSRRGARDRGRARHRDRAGGRRRRRANRCRGPLRHPRLRRQPHPSRLRGRSRRGVRRAHGRPAVRGGRHPRDDRGHARGERRRSCSALAAGAARRGAARRHHDHRDQVGLRPRRRGRAPDLRGRCRDHRRGHLPRRPRGARRSTTAAPTNTSRSSAARCWTACAPLCRVDRRLLRARRLRRRPVADGAGGRPRGGARTARARQPARARARGPARGRARRGVGRPLHVPRRRRRRGARRLARRWRPSCRPRTSRPASPIPTRGA